MAERNILFLYNKAIVPDLILETARTMLPEGFALTLCDNTASIDARRESVSGADFVVLYGAGFDDVDVAQNVRLLQLLSAGYDRLDLNALAEANIPVADNGGANAQTVAEHTVLLMLAVLKKLPLHHNALVQGEWLGLSQGLSLRELCDKQVGIIGFGRIGQRVARMVAGFSARPVYFDVRSTPEPVAHVAEGLEAQQVEFGELLATSDIVTLHTPLNAASKQLIGLAELTSMRSTAILINTSRGGVVDQPALEQTLASGGLAGAGLDVFATEPLGPDSPLLSMSNVVVTPHVAGTTLDTWSRRLQFAYDNVQRVAAGEPALSLIGPTP